MGTSAIRCLTTLALEDEAAGPPPGIDFQAKNLAEQNHYRPEKG